MGPIFRKINNAFEKFSESTCHRAKSLTLAQTARYGAPFNNSIIDPAQKLWPTGPTRELNFAIGARVKRNQQFD